MIDEKKCAKLKALHEGDEPFVIPNPWDCGSARLLQGLGFKALATTSSGFAFTLGRDDGNVSLEEKIVHCQLLAAATEVPVSVDFENGFSDDTAEMAENIKQIADTGAAGCSIEDYSRETKTLYGFSEAVDRMHAAAEAVRSLGAPFQLTARAENLIRGVDDLDDTIKRLQAFEAAGADLLYAPGLRTLDQIKTVRNEVSKPINVLAAYFPNSTVQELAEAGAHRISLGGAMAWLSLKPVIEAGEAMINDGDFSWHVNLASGKKVSELIG